MSRNSDPRPGKTKAQLWEALIGLVQEKRWDRIRVQDILDRAEVGRSTFYAHFDNKFDLLTSGIPSITFPIAESDAEPDLLPMFEHVAEMRPILLPLMSQPLLGEIVDTFQRGLATAWTEHLATLGVPEPRRDLAGQLLAGGLMAVLRSWLADGCTRDAGSMCTEFTEYTAVIVASCRRDSVAA